MNLITVTIIPKEEEHIAERISTSIRAVQISESAFGLSVQLDRKDEFFEDHLIEVVSILTTKYKSDGFEEGFMRGRNSVKAEMTT